MDELYCKWNYNDCLAHVPLVIHQYLEEKRENEFAMLPLLRTKTSNNNKFSVVWPLVKLLRWNELRNIVKAMQIKVRLQFDDRICKNNSSDAKDVAMKVNNNSNKKRKKKSSQKKKSAKQSAKRRDKRRRMSNENITENESAEKEHKDIDNDMDINMNINETENDIYSEWETQTDEEEYETDDICSNYYVAQAAIHANSARTYHILTHVADIQTEMDVSSMTETDSEQNSNINNENNSDKTWLEQYEESEDYRYDREDLIIAGLQRNKRRKAPNDWIDQYNMINAM